MIPIIGPDNFFKGSYVINLASRKDRYNEFEQMLSQYNIGVIERFDAIKDHSDGAKGCAQSHLGVIRLAKEKRLENVLIFEDDALFVDGIEDIILPAIMQMMSISHWDLFYLGARLIAPAKLITPNVAKIIAAYCTHAYAVNQSVYDKILSYDHIRYKAIDVFYSLAMRDFYNFTCYPLAVHQRPSVSEIIGGHMDYRELLNGSYKQHIKT